MYIDIFILILLIASVLGLSVAILFIINLYTHMLKKIESTEQEKILLHSGITQKAEAILSEAHANNLSIISNANKKAQEIISQANTSSANSSEILTQKLNQLVVLQEQTLQKVSGDFVKAYHQSLIDIGQNNIDQLKTVSKTIESEAEKEIGTFSKAVEKETIDMEQAIKEKVEAEYQKIHSEIQAYKETEMKKIEASVYPLLQRVTELTLGKALSIEDQSSLVLKALEEAKQELAMDMNHEVRITNQGEMHTSLHS